MVMWQLLECLKINIIVSISPESIMSVLKVDKQLVTMPIIYYSQYWNPSGNLIWLKSFLITIGSKIKCFQDNNGGCCCGSTSATMSMKQIQSPSANIKPLVALTYHQLGSCTLLYTRCNRTTYFCNYPSFSISYSGPTETIFDINWCFSEFLWRFIY